MPRRVDCVYTLIDPRDWMVKYVGITDDPKARFSQHIHSHDDRYNPGKTRWIQEIKSAGYLPLMVIVHSHLTRLQAIDIEMKMVYEFLGKGQVLFNVDLRRPFSHWTQCDEPDVPIAFYKVVPLRKGGYWIVGVVDEEKRIYRFLEDHRVYAEDYHAYPKCKKLNQRIGWCGGVNRGHSL